MPPKTYAMLLCAVIGAAALTVAAVSAAGLPMAAFGLVALLAAVVVRLWR